jgi:hypothetical protein
MRMSRMGGICRRSERLRVRRTEITKVDIERKGRVGLEG